MNKKGFANTLLIVLVIVLFSTVGYFALMKKSPTTLDNTAVTPTPKGDCLPGQPECVDYLINSVPPDNDNEATPSKAPSQALNKGTIISLVVTPCSQGQYSCKYSYGAKAVLIGKNITSATMKSSGVSGSGSAPFDYIIGNMKKVSEFVNGDRCESTVRTGLQEGVDNFYVEAKDSQGNILKSDKLHLQYESASNITTIFPQRNEELQKGTSKEIKWSISNPPKNSWVKIDISKVPEYGQGGLSSQEAQVLVKTVPSDSLFVWNIPSNLEARRYEIRVDLYGDEADFNNTFIVRSITDFVIK